ncbi:P-loop containing nucleoside triphosphate hydrolase protein [Mycena latifolia]|nr:P-loop containing nucleoside triphosphate hydrolase protein [Mycena latifolia]
MRLLALICCLEGVSVSAVPRIVNNCPPPSRIFHGRRTILDKMHQYFSQSQTQQDICLLHGLGGTGKTQIALKFIEESASQFTDIFHIDASTIETIAAGLKNIATIKSAGNSSEDALQWLISNQEEWLLLFDNADDPKINLNDHLPQCSHGNILITSRNPGLCVYAGAHFTVAEMEEIDAVKLLLRSAAQDSTDDKKQTATEIVKVLHYLPLAIIQAGAFISKSGNLASYLALYAENKARLLNERPAQSHDNYVWTVYTTWQISFDQLSEQAKVFIRLCSFLHHQGISEDIFKNATKYTFKPSGPSKDELEEPLKVLSQAYSLISLDSEKNMFSIHPLVHEWTRSTLSNDFYRYCIMAITGMSLTVFTEEEMTLASLWMLPHIDFLLKGNSTVMPDFRHEFGQVLLLAGKPERAAELQAMVLEKRMNLLGEDHPATLESRYWLAWTYLELGKFKETEELDVVTFQKCREVLGDNHPDTLRSMGNLVVVYAQTGKFKEAEALAIALIQAGENVLGENHLVTRTAMVNLSYIYHKQGRYQETVELALVVLDRQKKVLGDNHPDTLRAMVNLGVAYLALGKAKEAEALALPVLEKKRAILGDNHPGTLNTMLNLAFIYRRLEKWREAEELGLRVLEKSKKVLGNTHPETLIAMANLASTYNKLGRFLEAEELEVVVLEERRNILGHSHPSTLRATANLGSTLQKLEKLEEAEELLKDALEKQTDLLGDTHPSTVETMQELAVTYTKLGKLKEAEDLDAALKRKQV